MTDADHQFIVDCIAWLRKKGQAQSADELENKLRKNDADIVARLRRVLRNKPELEQVAHRLH